MFIFSKHFGIKDSNSAEVLAILCYKKKKRVFLAIMEALRICSSCYYQGLVVESDSSCDPYWMACLYKDPWKYQFLLNEIKSLSSSVSVVF